jgi:hypothetical protein
MRGAGIGLLSLLIGAAIIMFIMFSGPGGGYVPTVMHKGKEAHDEAQQISNHASSGRPVSETVKLSEVDNGDRQFRRIQIVSMDPDSPFISDYHLQPGDEVSEIGGINVADNNDYGLASALLIEAPGSMRSLTVLRAGQKLTINPDAPLGQIQKGLFAAPGTTSQPS